MFPKNKRIPRKLFVFFKKEAKTFKNELFLIKVSKSPDTTRFCFSVSKKVAKSAVVRNKIRRIGYRTLSKYITKIKQNIMVLFVFNKIPEDNTEINQKILEILKRSNLIK